jgi:DNA-binding PadR family transcriptional regulator
MLSVLELAILGFLYEQPLHGYELKRRVAQLTGHVRPIADGTLYPAIKRLEKAGWLNRQTEPGTRAAPRHVLTLTDEGRAELRRRLREADGVEISDENHWFTVLAFLRLLATPGEQAEVLRRRLAFLREPSCGSRAASSTRANGHWAPRTSPIRSGRACC